MPAHDPVLRLTAGERRRIAADRERARRLAAAIRRRMRRGDGDDGAGVPADPHRPVTLDGGAAAALEFDD